MLARTEGNQILALQRVGIRHLGALRVDGGVVVPDFEVQVRAGRTAGRADIANDVALVDVLARMNRDGRHVAVTGFPILVVGDAYPAAVTAPPFGVFDDTIAGGLDRRTDRRGEVDAGMHLHEAEDRVETHAEGRRHARAQNRRGHQEAADILAVFVVILDVAGAARLVRIETVGAGLGLDFGVQQIAGFDGAAAFGDFTVENQLEGVAGLDVAFEVELVREQLNDLIGQRLRGAQGGGRGIERAVDRADGDAAFIAYRFLKRAQTHGAVARSGQCQLLGGAGPQGQAQKLRGLVRTVDRMGNSGLQRHAGLDGLDIEGLRQKGNGGLGLGRRDTGAGHGIGQAFAGLQRNRHINGLVVTRTRGSFGIGLRFQRHGGGRIHRGDGARHGLQHPPQQSPDRQCCRRYEYHRRQSDRLAAGIELSHGTRITSCVQSVAGRSGQRL